MTIPESFNKYDRVVAQVNPLMEPLDAGEFGVQRSRLDVTVESGGKEFQASYFFCCRAENLNPKQRFWDGVERNLDRLIANQ